MGKQTAPVAAAPGQKNTASPPSPADSPPRLSACLGSSAVKSAPLSPDRTTLGSAGATDASADPPGLKVSSPDQLLTKPVLDKVFRWIHDRLTDGNALAEAWKAKAGLADDKRFTPGNGKTEEDVARAFPELFLGAPYAGPAPMYNMPNLQDLWHGTAYIYQRFQKKWWDWGDVEKRKQMRMWSRNNTHPTNDWKPDETAVKDNTDPAYPIVVACEHLATYVLLALGFVIETDMQGSGLSASGVDRDREVFNKNGGKWYERGKDDFDKVLDISKYESLPVKPRAGTFYAYDPMLGVKGVKIYLPPQDAYLLGPDGRPDPTKPDEKKRAAIAKARLDKFFANNKGTTVGSFDDKKAQSEAQQYLILDTNGETTATPIGSGDLVECNVTVNAQIQGSHAMAAIRYTKLVDDKTPALQLFNTSPSETARYRDEDSVFKPIGYDGMYDDEFMTSLDGHNPTRLIGMGVPAAAPDPDAGWLRKARPVGLARFVLLKRLSPTDPGYGTMDQVVYVSRLLRTWGDAPDQNYGYAKYLWSVRDMPYYGHLEPHWVIFCPTGALAGAMWAMGARTKKLDELCATLQAAQKALHDKQQRLKDMKVIKFVTAAPDGGLAVNRDYLPVVGITCNASGGAECTWRFHQGSDAGSGDTAKAGTLPQIVKALVMGKVKTGVPQVAWNKEVFHPDWAKACGVSVDKMQDPTLQASQGGGAP